MFYIYVLQSATDSGLYIGYSSALKRRIREHFAGAAFATSYRAPWKLIYYEAYLEKADAVGREQFLKSGSGRRLLRNQLRHHFATNPARSPQTHADDIPQKQPRERQLLRGTHVCKKPGLSIRSPIDEPSPPC